MKTFEHTISLYLKFCTSPLMDPYQFAYQTNRSVEDAVTIALHHVPQQLESPNSSTHILFIDVSSILNSIKPLKFLNVLFEMNSGQAICHWILSFLWNRPQGAKVDNLIMCACPQHRSSSGLCSLLLVFYTVNQPLYNQEQFCERIRYTNDISMVDLISNNVKTNNHI